MMAPNNPKITRHICLTFWNADGVYEQKPELKYFLKDHHIDIMLMNETHLKPHHTFRISNYSIIRTDRPGIKGGTAIMYKNQLPAQQIDIPPLQTLEATGIKLFTQNFHIILIAAYKPPDIPLNPADIRSLSSLGQHVIIAGDLNCKHPHWNSRSRNNSGIILYEALPTLDVYPVSTTEPT